MRMEQTWPDSNSSLGDPAGMGMFAPLFRRHRQIPLGVEAIIAPQCSR
jgi:hypothetical protein